MTDIMDEDRTLEGSRFAPPDLFLNKDHDRCRKHLTEPNREIRYRNLLLEYDNDDGWHVQIR